MSSKKSNKYLEKLSLGSDTTEYSEKYSAKLLQAIPNKNSSSEAWTSFICTEFTSLCPKTGQPDFAKIYINYIADKFMVESKSLKLYLFSYRNHGDFHEECVQKISDDIFKLIRPNYLEVIGEFTPRGGIAIYPYVNCSNKKKKFIDLKNKRLAEYSPGKYSMSLSKIY